MDNKNKLIRNSTAEFLIFTSQSGEKSIEAKYEDETIWLSQKLMAALFDVEVNTINYHLKEIYKSREIEEKRTIRKFRIVQTEGKREVFREVDFYNLDAIISVGYRVNSVRDILKDVGAITAEIAKQYAESEFEKYRIVQDQLFESDFDKEVLKQLDNFSQSRRDANKKNE